MNNYKTGYIGDITKLREKQGLVSQLKSNVCDTNSKSYDLYNNKRHNNITYPESNTCSCNHKYFKVY